jgi:phytanoyl-CoA hydroxylase
MPVKNEYGNFPGEGQTFYPARQGPGYHSPASMTIIVPINILQPREPACESRTAGVLRQDNANHLCFAKEQHMTTLDSPAVTEKQIEYFREKGYLHYGPLFNEAEQLELRNEIQEFIDGAYPDVYRTDLWPLEGEPPAPVGHERFLQMLGLWKMSDIVRRYAIDKRRGQIIAALLGVESVQLLADMVLYKPPGKQKSRPSIWHQDFPTNPNSLPDVTSWMPLDDVSLDNGCMQYIPGSHTRGGMVEVALHPIQDNRASYEKAGIDFSTSQHVDMNAGEVLFHHSNMVHYSTANITDRPRRVYITRYMPSESIYNYRPEINHLYDGWHLEERHGQPFPQDEFPLVYAS